MNYIPVKLVGQDSQMQSYVAEVQLDKLNIDTYQRKLDEKHVAVMGQKQLTAWHYPIVSYRNRHFYVVDGQHFVALCRLRGWKTVLVILKLGLTRREEAELFAELNTAKRPDPWTCWAARLMAEQSKYMELTALAHKEHLTLGYEAGEVDLRNTSPIMEAYKKSVYPSWLKMVGCWRRADGHLVKDLMHNAIEFQRGIIDLLTRTNADRPIVYKTLGKIDASAVTSLAKKYCACGRTNRNHYFKALAAMLNRHGLTVN